MSNILDQWEAEAKDGFRYSIESKPNEHPLEPEHSLNQRILALIELIRKKDAALSSVTTWFARLSEDHTSKLNSSFEEACNNWDSILQEPLDMDPVKKALALTEELK